MKAISILDNDLYKFSMQSAVCQIYPNEIVRYEFFDRGNTKFHDGFARDLNSRIHDLANLRLTPQEHGFLKERCPFLSPVYLDFLKGYQFNPSEVRVSQHGDGRLGVYIEGPWYRTILWEVPLMAMISEMQLASQKPMRDWIRRAEVKGDRIRDLHARVADFGTRRRYSHEVQKQVVQTLKSTAGDFFVGTSNVYMAMQHNLKPIGTQAHEWFMFHGARYGYREANHLGLKRWSDVYDGDLGIALSDTFTSKAFFGAYKMKYAKLFDGVRQDSGDPIELAKRAISHYESMGIDPKSKTVVFSDGLDLDAVERIQDAVGDRIKCSYGIGTNLTNDVGIKPLNIVIKLTGVYHDGRWIEAIKLSDNPGKHLGSSEEISACKLMLGLT